MNNTVTPQMLGWMLGVFSTLIIGVMFAWLRTVKNELKAYIDQELAKSKEICNLSVQRIDSAKERIEDEVKCFRTKYEDHYKTYHSKKD